MRSLLLALKILITASLLIHPIDSLASASKKINSGKKSLKKNNILRDSGNVWDIVRDGKLPRYFSNPVVATATSQSLPANTNAASGSQKTVLIKTTVLPSLHHDDESRSRLHVVIGANNKPKPKTMLSQAELKKQIDEYVNTGMAASLSPQSRVRTRIESRPQADKLDAKLPTETVSSKRKPDIIVQAVVATPTGTKLTKVSPEKQAVEVKQLSSANERIGKHISWYSQHSGYVQQVAERARPYLYHIVSELKANHLPTELALLPIVESAYQPTAQSPKSAAGLWQFIPSTGLDFDLSQSDHYDARLDIDASTKAAVRYLSMLKHHFKGDWLLALAAYNCGQGRVDDAISSNRAKGLPTDYWSLHLPEETQEYVPRFLALSSIFSNPKGYGVKLPAVKNEPYFVKVKVDRKFDIDYLSNKPITTVAELANLSYEQFVQLNPGYLKSTLEADRPFTLLLPASNANQLNQHLSHVARFLAEPNALASNSVLHKKPKIESDTQKDLPIAAGVSSLVHQPTRFSSPLLSLTINPNQTTPRVTSPPVITDIRAITLGAIDTTNT